MTPASHPITLEQVKRALAQPLLGAQAHQRMATRPRPGQRVFLRRKRFRQAAVLALLYECEGTLWLPLIRRAEGLRTHRGQIALPGGARDAGDDSLWAAALREAHEELGIDGAAVRLLGALSPLWVPASYFEVHPFVGWSTQRPFFAPNATEVAEVIEMPLELLLDPQAKGEVTWPLRGRMTRVPHYRWQGRIIWGATAMMLSELEILLATVRGRSTGEGGV